MDRFNNALIASILVTILLAAPVLAFADNDGLHRLTTPVGGVAFEVVGQVTNFPPAGAGQPATSKRPSTTSFKSMGARSPAGVRRPRRDPPARRNDWNQSENNTRH